MDVTRGVPIHLPEETARRDSDGPRDGVVIAVDAGGTKTLAAGLDLATGEVLVGRAGPANPDAVGLAAAVAAIAESVREACGGRRDVRRTVVAGAGTDAVTLGERVVAEVPSSLFVNDVVAAWATVAHGDPAIAIIAGTGSNCLGVDDAHRAVRVGGWGHVFGDEGSGWWIGREAVHVALLDLDGRGEPTALSRLVSDELGVADPGAAAIALYARQAPKADVAALTVLVVRAAAEGDDVARRVLADAGSLLAAHVVAVADALRLPADAGLRVGLTGSTWKAGGSLRGAFDAAVSARLPSSPVGRVDAPPVTGALALALHAAGRTDAIETLLPTATRALTST